MRTILGLGLVLYFVKNFSDVRCMERICSNEQRHCTNEQNIELNAETSDDILESKITSILALSEEEENVNTSVKWSYVTRANATSVLSTESLVNYIESDAVNKSTKYSKENDKKRIYEKKINEQEFIGNLSAKVLAFSQPFDASRNPSSSQFCREHTRMFLDSLKNFDLWALQMHDSSGHLTSGILNGNINQFGDFDQCLNVKGPLDDLRGQYCLAYMQPSVSPKAPYLTQLYELIQSHGAFKSDFNDPGHRVPRYSLINWALCIPSSCTAEDVEISLKEYIANLTSGTGIKFQIRVEPQMCQVKNDTIFDQNTKLASGFFVVVIFICLLSTLYEYNSTEGNRSDWLTAFSLRKNTKWLFNTSSSPGDIKSVHGIRFFNAVMLLISHKSMAIFFNPYVNRTQMTETIGQPWTVIGRAASVYTDPFLLFSGMLTTYSLIGRLQKGQPIRLRSEYIGRLMRIVPTLGALILFCTYILPLLGSGPQWNLVVGHHSDLCKKYWWRNLLFIHNYFGFSNMCLTHTHHLGIDTDLFLFAPIVVLCLWKWPKKSLAALLGLVAISTGARFYTTVTNRLSNYIYFGTTIKRLFKTADFMYSYPPHRATVYMLGILLGYALRVYSDLKFTNTQLRWGWFIGIICFFGTLFGPAPMGDITYKYNPVHAGYYAAFAPIAWCTLFIWIVFTSHLGYKNGLSRFLSWRGFQVTTKLSYAIYLTQFPVFFFNVGRKRNADHFSFIPLILNTNEYFCIFLSSVVLTLLFDAPFQNIKKLIFKVKPSSSQKITQESIVMREKEPIVYSEKHVKNVID